MSEFVLSPSLVPHLDDWSLIDYTGIQQSPTSGAIRTISRGQRWQAHVQFHDLVGDDRAFLAALMARVRGKSNRMWVSSGSAIQRGSFPAPELLTNNYFQQGAAGWTVGGAATAVGYNRVLSFATSGIAASSLYQNVSVVAGAAYAIRACLIDGIYSVPISMGVKVGSPTNSFANVGLSRGLITAAGLMATSGVGNEFAISITAGSVFGSIVLCTYASMRRCALAVNPSATTYSTALPIDALPINTNGLLLAGDQVEVNNEFKTVIFDLNSDAGGTGTLFIEPALRAVVPDECPIIIGQPMMRGILSNNAMQVTRPGVLSDYDFTFQEA